MRAEEPRQLRARHLHPRRQREIFSEIRRTRQFGPVAGGLQRQHPVSALGRLNFCRTLQHNRCGALLSFEVDGEVRSSGLVSQRHRRAGMKRIKRAAGVVKTQADLGGAFGECRAVAPRHREIGAVADNRQAVTRTIARQGAAAGIEDFDAKRARAEIAIDPERTAHTAQAPRRHAASLGGGIERREPVLPQRSNAHSRPRILRAAAMRVLRSSVKKLDAVTLHERLIHRRNHAAIPRALRPEVEDRRAVAFLAMPRHAIATGDDFNDQRPVVLAIDDAKNPQQPDVT